MDWTVWFHRPYTLFWDLYSLVVICCFFKLMKPFDTPTAFFCFSHAKQKDCEKCPLGLTFIPHLIPSVIHLPLKVTSLFHWLLCNGRPLIAISRRGQGREGEHVYLCVCTCLSSDSLCSTHPAAGWRSDSWAWQMPGAAGSVLDHPKSLDSTVIHHCPNYLCIDCRTLCDSAVMANYPGCFGYF